MMMNGMGAGIPEPINVALARIRLLLQFVDQSIQAQLSLAQGATVFVPETQLLLWRTILTQVLEQLRSFPVPAIQPPPRWAILIGQAITPLTTALQLLTTISTTTQPTGLTVAPGTPAVPTLTLQQVQGYVRLALLAVQAAEQELPR